MLIVEGAADELIFEPLCAHGQQQVFAAGNRDLVEQLLRHLQQHPIEGCDCLYLVDCDGYGKTTDLKNAKNLLVTETCDMEADLVQLGAARRLARRYMGSDADSEDIVSRACALALPLSIVRRAAFQASVSMRKNRHQLRLADLPDLQLVAWEQKESLLGEVLASVASELEWSKDEEEKVRSKLDDVSTDFGRVCLGKDALDALFRLLRQEGNGEIRGWNLSYFYKALASELQPADFEDWEVGRRLRAWEKRLGHELVKDSDSV